MADLSLRECIDHLRAYHGRVVKPFEKLPQILDAAVEIIEQRLPAAHIELRELTRIIGELKTELPTLEQEVTAARTRATVAIKDAQEAEGAAGRAGAETDARARERNIALVKQFEAKSAALEAEYHAAAGALAEEIRQLEQTRDRLAQEVAAHRDKFRTF